MEIQQIPIEQIRPSPSNPRQYFDPETLKELAASVRARGIDSPLKLRPVDSHLEIVAGERRYRAAQVAGLETVPAIVQEMTEAEAFEAAVVENVQRASLTPIEEARSFFTLLANAGAGGRARAAQTIAERVGKSATYVWDMAKLVDLTPEAAALLERGLITVRHAVPLARLTPDQQKKAIAPPTNRYGSGSGGGGLFTTDSGFMFNDVVGMGPTTKADRWAGVKAVSVREFEAWIAKYIRFDPTHAAAAAPLDFGPVAEQVQAAAAVPGRGKKVVHITHDHYVQPDAKNDERVYTTVSWRLADGSTKKAPTCDRSVLGLIVVGPEYGKTHQVCVNKYCETHWGKEKKARENRVKSGRTATAAQKRDERQEKEREKRQLKEEADRAAWQRAKPALSAALFEAVKTAKLTTLIGLLLKGVQKKDGEELAQKLGAPKTPEVALRHLAALELHEDISDYWWRDRWTAKVKAVGIDVTGILAAQAKPTVAAPAAGKPQPGTCRVCGCTDDEACEDGCGWADATETICDQCAQKAKQPTKKAATPKSAKKSTPAERKAASDKMRKYWAERRKAKK